MAEILFSAFAQAYKAFVFEGYLGILALSATLLALLEIKTQALSKGDAAWFKCWLLIFPLFSVIFAMLIAITPLGWSALAGWIVGEHAAPVSAKVISLSPKSNSHKSCQQTARLEINNDNPKICLDGRIRGPEPKEGDTVAIYGRKSVFGLYVKGIRVSVPVKK